MSTLFLVCAVLGGTLLALQIVGGLFGSGGDALGVDHEFADGEIGVAEGLDLKSLRAFGAGTLFFGLTGITLEARGWLPVVALAGALAGGAAAAVAVAAAMRSLRRLEADGTVRIERAVGQPATVYLSIPGERSGPGKVTLVLQGRTVEYQAVSQDALPTGAPVLVVDVVAPGVVEVVPSPHLPGAPHASL